MRFIHTSDIHFGISLCEYSLVEIQHEVVREILRCAEESQADGLIIAGDVFDRAVSAKDAISLYDSLVSELFQRGIQVFAVAGNHDGADRLSMLEKPLSKIGIHIKGKLTADTEPVSLGNTDIYFLPFFNLDKARSVFAEEEFSDYQQAFSFVVDRIRSRLDRSRYNIIISHCYVSGGQLSESDRSARLGQTMIVPPSVFEGFDYAALGHLHAPHNVSENVRYSGTPYPYSFGEKGGEKTLTLVDTQSGKITELPLDYSKKVVKIEGDYLEIIEMGEKKIHENDFVKVVLKDRYASSDIRNRLEELFPFLLQLEGKAVADPSGLSMLAEKDLAAITPMEVLKDYFRGREDELTEFEIGWFNRAVEVVEKGDDLQ